VFLKRNQCPMIEFSKPFQPLFGTSSATPPHMTVAVVTELGAGAGVGLNVSAGFGANLLGKTAAVVAGRSTGKDLNIATLERANGMAEKAAAGAATHSNSQTWLFSGMGSSSATQEKETFKANWQSMLRAWGVSPGDSEEIEEKAHGPSREFGGPSPGGGRSAGNQALLARAGSDVARSHRTESGGDEATGMTMDASRNIPHANLTQSPSVATIAQPSSQTRAAASGTEIDASTERSSARPTLDKKANDTSSAATPQPSEASTGLWPAGLTSGIEVAMQTARPIQVNVPPPHLNPAATRADDPIADHLPFAKTDLSAVRAAVSQTQASGAASIVRTKNLAAGAHAAEPGTFHASQSATPARTSAGASAATEDGDGGQEEFTAASLLKAPAIAGDASSAALTSSVANAGFAAGKPAAEAIEAHRAEGAGHHAAMSGSSAAPVTNATREDKPNAEAESHRDSSGRTVQAPAPEIATPALLPRDAAHASAQTFGSDGLTMACDAGGAHGVAGTLNTASGSSTETRPAAQQEPFAALDAGVAMGTPSWVHAGGRQAEAGFEDPALGWVGVRADLSAGGVHAAVVSGSAEAAQALSGHLAGLSTYLAENHTPVATLTMAAHGDTGNDAGLRQGAGQSGDQGLQQGMNQGAQQGLGQRGEQSAASAPETRTGVSPASSSEPVGRLEAYPLDGRGAHISVMA
jgi:hypothetical protein